MIHSGGDIVPDVMWVSVSVVRVTSMRDEIYVLYHCCCCDCCVKVVYEKKFGRRVLWCEGEKVNVDVSLDGDRCVWGVR